MITQLLDVFVFDICQNIIWLKLIQKLKKVSLSTHVMLYFVTCTTNTCIQF